MCAAGALWLRLGGALRVAPRVTSVTSVPSEQLEPSSLRALELETWLHIQYVQRSETQSEQYVCSRRASIAPFTERLALRRAIGGRRLLSARLRGSIY